MSESSTTQKVKWRRRNPYPSLLLRNRLLSLAGSGKEVRHYEFDLGESGIQYEPGDGLAVIPENDPQLVADLLARLEISPDRLVEGKDMDFRTWFMSEVEICKPSSFFLEALAERSHDEELSRILSNKDREALDSYLWSKDSLDLLRLNPGVTFSSEELVRLFRPLMHRTYSISSSQKKHPGQVHATIDTVRYFAHGRHHNGVCSSFLSDRKKEGQNVGIFLIPNKNFQLPADDDAPVIMVGPGTGVAPFLAFLQERRLRGAKGKNWLFFGDRNREFDYIYRDELEEMHAAGPLTRLDLAFSRDQKEKRYVQHVMKEKAAEIYDWIKQGAYFYVCGDALRMAPDVDEALREIISEQEGLSAEEAVTFTEEMQRTKHYMRDVY